jgi:two-component system sensor histidine kinase HydH
VFTRTLSLKLLAPTVLVSAALVGACIFAAVFLNRLHVHVSEDLSENVQSTEAAESLELEATGIIGLLNGEHANKAELTAEIEGHNGQAGVFLDEAERLANHEREKDLVRQIAKGFRAYLGQWEERNTPAVADLPKFDRRLARQLSDEVLNPCLELRRYNASLIQISDDENQKIVKKLYWGLLAVGLGAPLGGLLLGYAVSQSLRHSIYQLSVGIRDAAGRLNRELGSVTLEEEGDLPDLHRQLQGVLTEIERVVEQLQQREREVLRAEQLAAVGQVAAGVAHELRNPLTSVKMLVQTGLESNPSSAFPTEDLLIIEHEVRRMEQCIQMFLDFARPPRSERRQADLVAVIRRSLSLMEGRAHRQKVTFVADLPSEPISVMIDPEQIHQVMVNLLLNALDALPRGGTVHVTVSDAHAGANGTRLRSAERALEICIRDTGGGIAPRIRERLFEPFVSSKETGVGLGLSICKRLIEAHGGAIRGDNQPEGGALFAFTLPR